MSLEELDEWINQMGDFQEDVTTDHEYTDDTDDSLDTDDTV